MVSSATTGVPPRGPRGLVTGLQAGESALLEALVSDHAPRAWRLAHALIGDARAAEAVAQDVTGRLLEGSQGGDPAGSLGVQICRLTVTATLARMAAEGGVVAEGDRFEDWLPVFDASGHRLGDPAALQADWSATPGADAPETCARAREATRWLPLDHRVVLFLRDGEGLSEDETAEVLGASRASIRARLHRARMALRERLSVEASARR
jgi:RNA polymerase sigma-70 factor (ECF subfamily)